MTVHSILVIRSLGNTAEGVEGSISFPLMAALTGILHLSSASQSLPLAQIMSSSL